MAKSKEILYPSAEWVENWVDNYLDKNPNEKITDFDALKEQAEEQWWDKQVDLGNPTPFDLSAEKQKVAKQATITTSKEKKKPTAYKFDKKVRPKDAEKVQIVENVADFLKNCYEFVEISNAGQEIVFKIGENDYSFKLTKHRPPKNS